MAVIKCKMCGGDLKVVEGESVCECEYCGSRQTVPSADNEKKMTLFSRASRLLRNCEFDKAAGVFESIVADFPEEAEAYWGLVLCKYGIEYVDDPSTGKKIPTCHRSSFESVLDDSNFEQACENADAVARRVYRDEARAIEELRKSIIEVSGKEEPYDIFISYKETDGNGDRTLDSVIAQDIYTELTEKGYRVFFSRISLEGKLGIEYEPYIFAALNSAKVMIVVGTDYENFDAVWVKNEWSRFLKLIASGQKKTLIPVFKNMDAYDMPKEFAKLSAQDMGKVGAMQDLLRGVEKILGANSQASRFGFSKMTNPEASALTQRGKMALEDENFKGAEDFFERSLDINPTDARAYLGKFLAYYGLSSLASMKEKIYPLDDNKEFRRALQFADPALSRELREVKEYNDIRAQQFRLADVLKKTAIKKALKETVQLLAQCNEESYRKAIHIYYDLAEKGYLSKSKCSEQIKNLESAYFVLRYLNKVLEPCSLYNISSEAKENGIIFRSIVLDDLYNMGLLEKIAPSSPEDSLCYAWPNAKEEKNRRFRIESERKQEESRKKASFDASCAKVDADAQKEIDSITKTIGEQYDHNIRSVQKKIETIIAEDDVERDIIKGKMADLKRQQSSLGIFKGKEKKAIQEQLDDLRNHLEKIPTSAEIQEQFQPEIDRILDEMRIDIDTASADVRSKAADVKKQIKYNIYPDLDKMLAKMEKMKEKEIGDEVCFGSYYSQSNKKEPIEWIVLSKDKNRLLLISKNVLDSRRFHEDGNNVAWEKCDLRKWLNESFLRSAFSKEEQSFIPTVNVKADKNPENSFLDAGNPTQDKVYLLSIPEVKELLSSRPEIICFPTQYAKDRGCSMDEFNIFCWWWLRTPGGLIPGETAGVRSDGTVDWRGRSVNFDGGGVRPALWLDFTV